MFAFEATDDQETRKNWFVEGQISHTKIERERETEREGNKAMWGGKQWMQQLFAPINGCLGHHASPGTHRRRMAHKLAYLNDTAPQIGLATFFFHAGRVDLRGLLLSHILITFFFCASENARLQTLMSSESKSFFWFWVITEKL